MHSRLESNGKEGNSTRRTQRATELKGKKRRKAQSRQDKKDAGQEIGVPRRAAREAVEEEKDKQCLIGLLVQSVAATPSWSFDPIILFNSTTQLSLTSPKSLKNLASDKAILGVG